MKAVFVKHNNVHLQQHELAHGASKQFSDKECFNDKTTLHITGQVDKYNLSLGGMRMVVRRKYILYNKPNENLWAVFLL